MKASLDSFDFASTQAQAEQLPEGFPHFIVVLLQQICTFKAPFPWFDALIL